MSSSKLIVAALFALALLPARAAFASGDLAATLSKLDAAAARFHSTSADFQFDTVQTQPVPDTETQTGLVYYERSGAAFHMGVHIQQVDGQPAQRTVVCCQNGQIKLYEKNINQVTTLSKLSQYESWFMLGFGASGKEMAAHWDITDQGPETFAGVQTEKLALIPKDPGIRKNIPQVTVWMDLNRGISLKQVFDEGQGQSRTATYTHIKMNQSLPADAFTFTTDKSTTYVNR
jgi:outer membrane lipoprotein-sorting protein